MSDVQVSIDPDRCIGAAQCVLTAPALFRQDDNGVSGFVGGQGGLSSAEAADARAAGLVCPVGAIAVSDPLT